jgi:hypothetical protein
MFMGIQVSAGSGRKITLEPFSGGFFTACAKDVEIDLGGGGRPAYIPELRDGRRVYGYSSISGKDGRVLYQDVTQD